MIKKATFLNQKNIFYIVCILCFLLDIFALIVAKSSPATGYESSIYKSTPIIFWISVIFSIISGVILIIYSLLNKNSLIDYSKLLIVALFLIFLNYTMCLSLPIIRSYYMWCMNGDPATHIGIVNQIISTGNISNQLIYPILHIYSSQIILLTNTDIITLHKLLPFFFGILYVPFIYLFSKSIFSDKNQIILSTVFGCTFINSNYFNFTPNGLSNLYFPLFLYALFKVSSMKNVSWELFILILALLYPTFHPVPSFVTILIVIALSLGNFIFPKLPNVKTAVNKEINQLTKLKITLLMVILVISITWISSFYIWTATIKNLYLLATEGSPTQISSLIENINYAHAYGYNVSENVLKLEGGPLLYVLISLFSLPIIWKNKDNINIYNLFSLYWPLISISLVIIIFYFGNLLFSPLRLVIYIVILSTPFVGFSLNYLINEVKRNNVKHNYNKFCTICLVVTTLLLFITWINGILVLYPSPYTLTTSQHSTESEVKGMNWTLNNKNADFEMMGMSIAPFRFGYLLLTDEQRKLQHLSEFNRLYCTAPFHFGYNNNSFLSSYLSNYYNQSLYLLNTERDKRIYIDIFPEMAKIRWTPDDFEKLDYDISINKIYSSENFNVYKINGSEKVIT